MSASRHRLMLVVSQWCGPLYQLASRSKLLASRLELLTSREQEISMRLRLIGELGGLTRGDLIPLGLLRPGRSAALDPAERPVDWSFERSFSALGAVTTPLPCLPSPFPFSVLRPSVPVGPALATHDLPTSPKPCGQAAPTPHHLRLPF